MRLFFAFIFLVNICSGQEQVSFFFDTNKFELNSIENQKLLSWIEDNKSSKVLSIIGMTDAKGTSDYNDELSLRRVDHIVNKLKNQIQFRSDFKSIGLGETISVTEEEALNRKVTIYYLKKEQIFLEEYIINDYQVTKQLDSISITDVEKFNISPKWTLGQIVSKVPKGTLFTLEDIQFQFDSAQLLSNAKIELDKWLQVLNEYPNLKIVIQGHICCIPKDEILLSSQRAKSVMTYLLSKGIASNRLQYVGFGSSKPKFKIPERNGYEALMNRRVEIILLEK
ncbi:OmpA family protein [Flavobacterium sp.]|jgi:outer membrane protein OmpA-like peptidoglycan-associated protein|uniref:OmpA family protein n=1 Tax=Flavobacterium sp. TaxID=239 RepID=UPI0037C132F2